MFSVLIIIVDGDDEDDVAHRRWEEAKRKKKPKIQKTEMHFAGPLEKSRVKYVVRTKKTGVSRE